MKYLEAPTFLFEFDVFHYCMSKIVFLMDQENLCVLRLQH